MVIDPDMVEEVIVVMWLVTSPVSTLLRVVPPEKLFVVRAWYTDQRDKSRASEHDLLGRRIG